ncbi:MAG TPA: ankyrin repeat domain-containing protein [Pyrinomonadaceae bacterium]|nr:ankyrin repeat domain-containing protein [Pyrinomonadaceae bacterium]
MSHTRTRADVRDDGGNTPLMSAALGGQTETVNALLRNGADVNAENLEGRTALMFAVINLRTDSVKTLLQFGADVNVQAHCGCTPLTLAACSGDIGITQALLKSGADANKVCSPGKTALVVAMDHGYHALGELLKSAMGHSKQLKPERLLSDLRRRKRAAVLSATN